MLSKSQARNFFVWGTVACSVSFLLLTLDTIRQVPGQTNAQNITPEVARGKDLWDFNNCMGCHTLFGEGAYYAPELTKVYQRRGPDFIRAMIKDPEKMYPGQRKMQKYDFTDQEIEDLVSFFKWVGEVDLNGFPRPTMAEVAKTSNAVSASLQPPKVFDQLCIACHKVGGQGGDVGPSLDGVGARLDSAYLEAWLRDPLQIKPDSKMPKLPLSQQNIEELVGYLGSLK